MMGTLAVKGLILFVHLRENPQCFLIYNFNVRAVNFNSFFSSVSFCWRFIRYEIFYTILNYPSIQCYENVFVLSYFLKCLVVYFCSSRKFNQCLCCCCNIFILPGNEAAYVCFNIRSNNCELVCIWYLLKCGPLVHGLLSLVLRDHSIFG